MSGETTPRFHDDTIGKLTAWVAEADMDADEHATRGGEARALAQQHLADAAKHDERAAQARAVADERRWLLRLAEANQKPAAFPPALPVLAAPVVVEPVLAAPELVPATPPAGLPQGVAPFGVPCPKGCGQLVYPGQNGSVHIVRGGTAAACPPPSDDDPAPTRVFDAPVLDAS